MTDLMPMLPEDQNRKLFGPLASKARVPSFRLPIILNELERLYGPLTGEETPTRTRLPDLGSEGPLAAVEGLSARYPITGLGDLASMVPVPPPVSPELQQGWTRYEHGTGSITRVSEPSEPVLLYDIETYVLGGNHPLIGVAASTQAWYVWMSPAIAYAEPDGYGPLIPVGQGKTLVAHNAMFDQSKTEEAYAYANQDRPYAVCTMALHTFMSGLGGDQILRAYRAIPVGAPVPWVKMACGDSLGAVLKHYTGREMSKAARDLFVKGSLAEIIADRDMLLAYAVNDVFELWHLWASLWPKFREHCPANFTIMGLMEASRSCLPVVSDWHERIASNDATHQALAREAETQLTALAVEALEGDPHDPWLSQLDWTPAKSGKNKGKPAWYRAAVLKKGAKLTPKSDPAPLLLRMSYLGHPLTKHKTKGWGYYVEGVFHRLPHKDGPGANVGSPLGKDFVNLIDKGVLTCDTEGNPAQALANLAYWTAFRKRFHDQYVRDRDSHKAIVPVTKLAGTLTGRQVEKLWLTASQAKKKRLGSDVTHAIQPPEGWSFVGWDEDTEEVRLASLYGDLQISGPPGSTPMSQSAFMGDKAFKTDPHSVVAKLAGFGAEGRQDAKVFNFQDIYGGGMRAQCASLQASHPEWSQEEVQEKVLRMMNAKRGAKTRGSYSGGTDSHYHNAAKAMAGTPDFRLYTSRRQIPHVINSRYDTQRSFYTSRYNFPTQGAGVDILHLTLVLVPWLADEAGIPRDAWAYVFARHDEVWYITKEGWEDEFAEVGHTAHAIAWACYFESLGFYWLPTRAARLSAVNIDKVFRKEVDSDTNTQYGLGWDIPEGRNVS